MKKWKQNFILVAAVCLLTTICIGFPVEAKESNTIEKGVYIGSIDVSGMTVEEASSAVESYIDGIKETNINLVAVEGESVSVTVGELGISWANPELAKEAVSLGKKGNVVERYKALKDLERENKIFELGFDFDKELIKQVISEKCLQYNMEAKDATLVKSGDGFTVTPGQTGYVVDEAASLEAVYESLTGSWQAEEASIELVISVDEPKGTEEELAKVKDVLGTFTTSFKSSGSSRTANVSNGCVLVEGATVYPGDEFSMYEAVAPFTEDNGYYMAGSYLNGKVVDSLGGGICQVSTTLYNAVLRAELEVTERHNHSMSVSYVDLSADAAIAESAGKDFKFVNNTNNPVYIDGFVADKNITFTIYGVEERPAGRKVSYESEVISVMNPEAEVLHTDPAIAIGTVIVDSAHVGYKAKLWKVVTEDGKEVSREQVNTSSYKMVPRTATVGLSTPDVNAYNEMLAAVATNNIDHVKNVAAALAAGAAGVPPADPAAQPPVEQPPADPAAQPPAAEQPPADPAAQPPAAEQPPAEQPPI